MARISGVDLPRDKKVEIGLTYIYGIGRVTARKILAATGVNPEQRIRDLSDADVNKLRQEIEKSLRVEGALADRIHQRQLPRLLLPWHQTHTQSPKRQQPQACDFCFQLQRLPPNGRLMGG